MGRAQLKVSLSLFLTEKWGGIALEKIKVVPQPRTPFSPVEIELEGQQEKINGALPLLCYVSDSTFLISSFP